MADEKLVKFGHYYRHFFWIPRVSGPAAFAFEQNSTRSWSFIGLLCTVVGLVVSVFGRPCSNIR